MGLNHKVRPNKCCVQKKQPRKNCEDNVMGENPGDPRFSNDFLTDLKGLPQFSHCSGPRGFFPSD